MCGYEGCGYEECACVSMRGVGMRGVHVWDGFAPCVKVVNWSLPVDYSLLLVPITASILLSFLYNPFPLPNKDLCTAFNVLCV